VGAGGWGTALACVLAWAGHRVRLWARRPEFAASLQALRRNEAYLPGVAIPGGVTCTSGREEAVLGADLVVFCAPAQALGEVAASFAPYLGAGIPLVSASKGLEVGTLRRMSEVLSDACGRPGGAGVLALSGPNFAAEVGRRLPAATVLASPDAGVARGVREWFAGCASLRVYTSTDVVGVELGGALKNVIALLAGLVDGMGLGQNARAGVITRGLAEITRLGVAMGADPLTFAGLSGLGDLVLTCTGALSRNQWAGRELGRGRTIEDILAGTPMVVEGVATTRAACDLASRHRVEMPLAREMFEVLFEHKSPAEVVVSALSRAPRDERDDTRRSAL
jgi:glycerol-3-phosphate dehydrogenase (NAD(P)+)